VVYSPPGPGPAAGGGRGDGTRHGRIARAPALAATPLWRRKQGPVFRAERTWPQMISSSGELVLMANEPAAGRRARTTSRGVGGWGVPVDQWVDQWISGGRFSHGGAEIRRKQREETATGHKGNRRVPCSCLCVKHPWLPTGVLHCPGPVIHPVRVHKYPWQASEPLRCWSCI
jgi:hypothetical protein